MTNLAKKEQTRRRTILIGVKNLFQKMIEDGQTIGRRCNGSYINLKSVYDDLQNFLYGKDFLGNPYLISIEEMEYYVSLYREIKKSEEERIVKYLASN